MTGDVDWAWFAGLFEGEGSISFTNAHSIRLAIESTDRDVLLRAQGIAEGNVRGPYRASGFGSKPRWQWILDRRDLVSTVLEQLEPHMCERRSIRVKEAQERLAHCASRKPYKARRSSS